MLLFRWKKIHFPYDFVALNMFYYVSGCYFCRVRVDIFPIIPVYLDKYLWTFIVMYFWNTKYENGLISWYFFFHVLFDSLLSNILNINFWRSYLNNVERYYSSKHEHEWRKILWKIMKNKSNAVSKPNLFFPAVLCLYMSRDGSQLKIFKRDQKMIANKQ